MSRSPLRSALSAALCAAFFAQSTGAADLAPMFARGMMLPPPGRMAPMPMPRPAQPAPAKTVKPAGEPWLVSAAVVARYISERWTEAVAADAAASLPEPEVAAVASLPSPEPPADRMLISMEGRRVLASGLAAQLASILQYRTEFKPLRPRFVGEWVGKGQARARVDYMNPLGVTRGEAKGFRVILSDGFERLLPNRNPIPNSLMRELPLYFAGDSVDVEVTILNTGSTPLTDLTIASVQEEHTASGEAGTPIGGSVFKSVASIAPGATAVLRWRIKLGAIAREAVNFEQTHLTVLREGPTGSSVLLDETQAGIVDPPSL